MNNIKYMKELIMKSNLTMGIAIVLAILILLFVIKFIVWIIIFTILGGLFFREKIINFFEKSKK